MKGVVKFYNDRKNYGFIEPEEGGEDLFVHESDVEADTLNEEDEVEFDTEESEKGPRAVGVTKIE